MRKIDPLPNRDFTERGAAARSKRQSNFTTIRKTLPAGQITAVDLSATEIIFQFDADYPHCGGENDFQFRINGGGWLQFLLPPAPPLEIGDFPIYKIEFWNKTAVDKKIRFLAALQPYATESNEKG